MCRGHRAALSHMALKEQERQRERGRWRGREWEWGRWKEKMKGRTRKREQTQVNVYKIKSTFTLSRPLQLVCCQLIFPDFSLMSSIFRLATRQQSDCTFSLCNMTDLSAITVTHLTCTSFFQNSLEKFGPTPNVYLFKLKPWIDL